MIDVEETGRIGEVGYLKLQEECQLYRLHDGGCQQGDALESVFMSSSSSIILPFFLLLERRLRK